MGAIGEWRRGPVIGRGATATVSIATDRRTGGVFAVKSVDVARAGALRREQGMLSALASPFVVPCVGSGVSAAVDGSGGACYDLFLEYAPGGSLADEIKRCGGRCEEPLIRSRVGDVLRGLAYVHAAGIAHCDVKGRNVLVGADGRAMLADFGCARWMAAEDCNAGGVTIRGTPMFLAPEAARGEAQGTARTSGHSGARSSRWPPVALRGRGLPTPSPRSTTSRTPSTSRSPPRGSPPKGRTSWRGV